MIQKVRRKVKGWKTRLVAIATSLLGILDLIDPNLLNEALGFDGPARAKLFIGIGVAFFILREVSNTKAGRSE